ncbi:MAG: spondin domain-containing protein [Gammaproteobacteria bacterium]|nr:spondin domain-containing protein [Gammaproteobacteria bacterium]
MEIKCTQILTGLSLAVLASTSALAADINLSLTNLTHGSHFTPLLVSAHDSSTHVFQTGQAASSNLRLMAECGDTSGILSDLGGADMDTIDNPATGLLAPGASTSTSLMTATDNTHLSIVAMILPTNDGFVGVDSLMIPAAVGTYTYYLKAYDAGTEANDETLPGSSCAVGVAGIPAAPNSDGGTGATGAASADSNTMVHIHRGVLGDSNPTGGLSDLDSSIHRWQNPVAKLVITVN